jgi:hypothetical protein
VGWLSQQLVAWQEILLGCLLLVVGLFAEDWIDEWRKRTRG